MKAQLSLYEVHGFSHILSIRPHTQPSQPQQDCSSCLGHRTQTSITDINTTPLLYEPPQTTSVSNHSLQQPKDGTQHLHSTLFGVFQGCCLQKHSWVDWSAESPEFQLGYENPYNASTFHLIRKDKDKALYHRHPLEHHFSQAFISAMGLFSAGFLAHLPVQHNESVNRSVNQFPILVLVLVD